MPRSGSKNPTPQRVARNNADCDPQENQKEVEDELPVVENLENAPVIKMESDGSVLKLPDDPDELMEALKQMPIEALYKENDVDKLNLVMSANNSGKYLCPRCDKPYRSLGGLQYHVKNSCVKYKRYRYTCLVCGADFIGHPELLIHINSYHLAEDNDESYISHTRKSRRSTKTSVSIIWDTESVDSNLEENDETMDEEEFVPDVINELKVSSEIVKIKMPVVRVTKRSRIFDTKSTFASLDHPFAESILWLHEHFCKLEKKFEIVHSNYTRNFNDFNVDGGFDLSQFNRSPLFQIMQEGKSKHAIECEGLDPFCALDSSKSGRSLTFNAGGPVWAQAWCPTLLKDRNSRQYLAISVHNGLHSISSSYHEHGLIQIWDCGLLQLHKHENDTPKLSYALSINEAPIWDLKWCPIGGKMVGSEKEEQSNTRLGILAVACASGKVLIVPIPALHVPDQSISGIYKARPSLSLLPTSENTSQMENLFGQCICVDWTLSDGGEWVAGGYCKGLVALWKVKNPHDLLLSRTLDSECPDLMACRTFHAHHKVVRTLSWCPYDENVLATAGADRTVKFWNKTYTEAPILETQVKGSIYTEITWPILWCGIYTSSEEAFAAPYCHGLSFHDLLLRSPTTLIPFKSVCWSVSNSNWMNCVVGGDAMGQAVIHACSNWSRKVRNTKAVPRILLYDTKAEYISTNDATMDVDENSFSNSEHLYKLIFHDTNLSNLSNMEKRGCCKKVRTQDMYPGTVCDKPLVQSINRVSWNPNFGSHTWIATGMQCGLVRLHCVDAMHSTEMDDCCHRIITSHDN